MTSCPESASRILFPSVDVAAPGFLQALTPARIKAAYRKQAKTKHPDKSGAAGKRDNPAGEFSALSEAYRNLLEYVVLRDREKQAKGKSRASKNVRYRKKQVDKDPGPPPIKEERPSRLSGDLMYKGKMPLAPLRFGRYLYYRGLISWGTLMEATRWQRERRPVFGRIAVTRNYISSSELDEIVCNRFRGRRPIGHVARSMGKLTNEQIRDILDEQAKYVGTRIGDFFVENGLLAKKEIQMLLVEHSLHNRRFRKKPSHQLDRYTKKEATSL